MKTLTTRKRRIRNVVGRNKSEPIKERKREIER